jgi:hypothetical protein
MSVLTSSISRPTGSVFFGLSLSNAHRARVCVHTFIEVSAWFLCRCWIVNVYTSSRFPKITTTRDYTVTYGDYTSTLVNYTLSRSLNDSILGSDSKTLDECMYVYISFCVYIMFYQKKRGPRKRTMTRSHPWYSTHERELYFLEERESLRYIRSS